jgi:hypothetical protein
VPFGCGERTVDSGSGREPDRGEGGAIAKAGGRRDEITVILLPEPPELNPEVAHTLLKILLKAYEKKFGHEYSPTADK